ncbi:MAG TPA: hypothetical protein VIJ94_05030 [Caulobacteraceae bacterium]
MKPAIIVGLAVCAVVAGSAFGQERRYLVTVAPQARERGFEKLNVSKATVGTNPIRIWANTAINPDCSVQGSGASLALVSPPIHGTANVIDDPYFASFPRGNPRSACNDRKVPGHQAFYTAAAGFSGHDRLLLRGTSPDGRVRDISVDIDVR